MRKILLTVYCGAVFCSFLFAQEQETREMPKLEIPEITIIGKKAITLPFARKGEIYDVHRYVAPSPDTSLLGERGSVQLPIVSLQRMHRNVSPWRFNAEGGIGSFVSANAASSFEYRKPFWNLVGKGAFTTTHGHVDNAQAASLSAQTKIQASIETDNDMLKTLRGELGTLAAYRKYGMFGISPTTVKRTTHTIEFNAAIGSMQQQGSVFLLQFETGAWNVSDDVAGNDSSLTTVTPALKAALATDFGAVRFSSEAHYRSSSYDVHSASASQSWWEIQGAAEWNLRQTLSIKAGGIVASSSGSSAGTQNLLMPFGIVRWDIGNGKALSVWWKPSLQLPSHSDFFRVNPYLIRALDIQPSKTLVHVGGLLSYHDNTLMVEVTGLFKVIDNKDIMVADDSGRIWLEYAATSVVQTQFQWNSILSLISKTRLKTWGTVQQIHERGVSVQLPMNPALNVVATVELDVKEPLMLWSGVEYKGKQNSDRLGTHKLNDVLLVNAGASYRVARPFLLSAEVSNLLNTTYEWWRGYPAPGITFTARLYWTIQ